MRIHRVEQGTAEWYAVRLGIPTASMFHKIITPTGKLSAQAVAYKYKLIAERLLKESMDDQLKIEWIEHGKVEQPNAARQIEFTTDVRLDPVGFVTSNDGRIGCSPDYLVHGRDEAFEVKCPAPWTQIGYLLDGPGADYRPQVQGQILVAGFKAVHFYAFHPRMPPYYRTTLPDLPFLAVLESGLLQFCDDLDRDTERARACGAYIANISTPTPLQTAYGGQIGPDPLEEILR